ncbi:CHAT domain-containing tetratricopeptide repeat protein [Microcoleus sp. FACHB-672]|uniref:CHAT domain-containing tetratricopeptide repeat protein n=1 Tax=Microcoleus sp. FACHB-672 TaxID=2692825 RepID=UPI0016865C12|nr:CHAT domain-containing tetratricopeptide repeat protein [Microcoleus sp. FACHB-672]MBD2042917.1 CHAT domain-containing protein [Microcoleus sp. FACHB-672]
MAQRRKQNLIDREFKKSLRLFLKSPLKLGNQRPSRAIQITLLLGILFLPSPVVATAGKVPVKTAQLSQNTPSDSRSAAADRAFEEGLKLFQEKTPQSLSQAIQKWKEALQLYQAIGDRAKQADTLSGIGSVYGILGDKQNSLEAYNQALSLYQAVNDKVAVADTLNSIGLTNADLGKFKPALESYNQALTLYGEAKDAGGEAYTLNNLGVVYDALSEYQQALDAYNRALPLWREAGEKGVQATTLNNIGVIYDALGQSQPALDAYTQALAIYREVNDKSGIPLTLNNIGLVYANSGKYDLALDYYKQALPLWQEVGNRRRQATTLNNIGFVYANTEQLPKALESYNQALPLWREAADRRGEASTLNNIGFVYASSSDHTQALNYYNQALPLRRALSDRPKEALTLYRLAQSQRQLGNLNQAKTEIEAAIEIIEDLRTKVDSQDLRTSFFASKQDYYEFYIDLLMQLHKTNPNQGYDAAALQVSERARARSLLEILTQAGAEIRQGVDPQLLERESSLQQQLATLEERRVQMLAGQHKKEQTGAINTQISTLLAEYRQVQSEIRAKSPRYAALTQPQPLTLSEIQTQVLDENTVLLEYSLGTDRSYLWAVTPTSISSYELPGREEIEDAARNFRDAVTVPSMRIRRQKTVESAAALSQIILAPVADQLADKRLLIVSDGALQYIPFAALPVNKNVAKAGTSQASELVPLVVKHELVNLPSASTIGILRREIAGRNAASKTLAVLADPVFAKNDERVKNVSLTEPVKGEKAAQEFEFNLKRLPFTKEEAEEILKLVPASQKTRAFGFAASRDIATSPELSEYRMVHFATHGILNSMKPELSGLVLSMVDKQGKPQDGFLRLSEIFNLNLPAELVVLSACETGLGQQIRGEGLVGLTRGFMYAGAARVVVSLWSVDDAATSDLMVNFYQGMLKKGLAPAAALRAAQIEMWQKQEWEAPFYWAGFTVQGEWR